MEGVAQKIMSGFSLDIGPLKEPLGFIRVLEWVFSIFAFATAGGYSGSSHINVQCQGSTAVIPVTADFFYPFRLPSTSYDVPSCKNNETAPIKAYLTGDFSSSAEFFVCIGVFGFLYCTATLVIYLGYQHLYRESSRGPVADLFLTGRCVPVAGLLVCLGQGLDGCEVGHQPGHDGRPDRHLHAGGQQLHPRGAPLHGPTQRLSDFWISEPDLVGRELLVYLQGDPVSQTSQSPGACGGRDPSILTGQRKPLPPPPLLSNRSIA
ncbi:hypothetical protein AAFF_G00276790 [Aldrovandia affinis]|uniref:MARVEL domain-containing protein n=1 Tax=Aldrovandia affinis TaxID=143900 RepID=A0AAD7RAH2_9TELE|nr:hypothetical protein AAFF_G00276790 [Aldrovandia affinis]